MPRNGSGVYSPPANTKGVPNTTIESSRYNTFVDDITAVFTGSVASDGQTGMTGALAMGGNKITGLGTATAAADAINKGDAEALANAAGLGKHTIWVPASAMTARTTNGAAPGTVETATNKIMRITLDFDQTTSEFAQFSVAMPKSWDKGTLTVIFYWTAGATGDVVWRIQAVAISNDDPIDAAFGAIVEVTDSVTLANDLMVSAETAAITVGGTPADGDEVVVQLWRFASDAGDTLAADAKLIGVKLLYTTDAATDD